MNVIVTVDYNHYLVSSKKEAAAIITALCGAIKLDRKFVGRKEMFYPAERQAEVGMMTVMPGQILRCDPPDDREENEDKPIPQGFPAPPKQLGFSEGGAK